MTLMLFLFLALQSLGISSSCGDKATAQSLLLSLTTLFFLFSSSLVRGLLGLKALFGLVSLIFSLHDLFVSLIILKIETYL